MASVPTTDELGAYIAAALDLSDGVINAHIPRTQAFRYLDSSPSRMPIASNASTPATAATSASQPSAARPSSSASFGRAETMALRGKLWFISAGPDEVHRRTVLDDQGGKLVGSANDLVGVFETPEAARRACLAINTFDAVRGALADAVPILEAVLQEREEVHREEDEVLRDLLDRVRAASDMVDGRAHG